MVPFSASRGQTTPMWSPHVLHIQENIDGYLVMRETFHNIWKTLEVFFFFFVNLMKEVKTLTTRWGKIQ